MKKLFSVLSFTLILSLLLSLCSFAINLPKPTNNFFVNDFADVIDAKDEQVLMQMGKSLYSSTGAQVVVVTVYTLEGLDVADYALQLGREWGVGNKDKNNGVVLLLAVSERKITIQVGYGLEGRLTDGKTGRILDKFAIPYLKDNNFSAGISEAYKAILSEVYEEYGVAPPENFGLDNYSSNENISGSDIQKLVKTLFIIFLITIIIVRRIGRRHMFFGPFFGGFYNGNNHHGGFGGGGYSSGGGFSGGGGSFGGGGSSRGF